MYVQYAVIMLIPTLLALFFHNFFCHNQMSIKRKLSFFMIYGICIQVFLLGIAWFRGIKGIGIVHMTIVHKAELVVIGCVFAFYMSLGMCLVVEDGVTIKKLDMYLKRFFKDIKKYYSYAVRSAKSDLRSEVANAYLDWLWWLIEPFCMMMIYTFIFGVVFRASEPYFPIFIFSGLAMWSFFSRGMNVSVNIIRNNKGIISKVYLPKFILYFARMLVNGFKMLVSFAIIVVMLVIFKVPVSANVLYIIPVMVVFFFLTFGLGNILMHFGVYVNDLSYIVGIVLSMLMYLTGIFYSIYKRIPEPFGELLEQFNPVAYCIASMRNALLYCQAPKMDMLILWGMVSLILSAVGVYIIYKNENAYVKVI